MQFLMPTVFDGDAESFVKLFDSPFDGEGGGDGAGGSAALNEEERLLLTTRMHEALRPFMLRRIKEKVAADLPTKREVLLRCAPSGYQAHLYRLVAERAWAAIAPSDAGGPKPRSVSINNVIMELVRRAALAFACSVSGLTRMHAPRPRLSAHCATTRSCRGCMTPARRRRWARTR